MRKKISLFSLVMLIVAGIDSIRNLPAMAMFGSSLIFFFVLSTVFFLIPVSLISAEFSARHSKEGGVFHWVRHVFGARVGWVAVWLQWINTMVWYPTILSFIAGTFAYLFNPALAQNKTFLVVVILVVFWGLTFLGLKGIRTSARVNDYSAVIGTLMPMGLIIACGIYWMTGSKEVHLSFAPEKLIPTWRSTDNWVSLVAIIASFLGMELSGVHVNDIRSPKKNFPRAVGVAIVVLVVTMLSSSLSIAVVVPGSEIRLVDGIMQFFQFMGWAWILPILVILIVVGTTGNIINWLLSPSKGLLQAAEYGFLPPYFTKKNRRGVAARILVVQAVLVSLFCVAFELMPSINAFYWFLTALSTELYLLMYLIVFAAALWLGRPKREAGVFTVPRGTRTLLCCLGVIGTLVTLVVGYFPPTGIDVGETLTYCLLIAGGNVVLIAPAIGLIVYQNLRLKR